MELRSYKNWLTASGTEKIRKVKIKERRKVERKRSERSQEEKRDRLNRKGNERREAHRRIDQKSETRPGRQWGSDWPLPCSEVAAIMNVDSMHTDNGAYHADQLCCAALYSF